MKKLSDFLGKFKALEHPDLLKEKIRHLIKGQTGFMPSKEQIEIKNKTVFVKGDSYQKTAIFLKREEILQEFKEKIPEIKVTAIR